MNSAVVVPLLHKSRPIGALNILSRNRGQFTAARRRDPAPVRRARRGRARQRAAVRAEPARRRCVRDARRDRPRGRVAARSRSAVRAHRAADQARGRLPHVRDPAARTSSGELEMKLAVQYGEKVDVPRVRLGEGLVGYAALHKEAGARAGRLAGSALHQAGAGRAVGAGDPDAAQGSLHRRLRSREPGARRVQQARRRDPDAAGEPGGGGDRERAAVRRGRARTRSGSRRKCASRSACRSRCCRRGRPSG